MAVVRLDRFTIDPADAGELLARRAALIDAVRDAMPGLVETRLVRLDDQTWIDMWRWDSRTNAQAAVARAPGIPAAAAAFSLVKDNSVEFAEVVDER